MFYPLLLSWLLSSAYTIINFNIINVSFYFQIWYNYELLKILFFIATKVQGQLYLTLLTKDSFDKRIKRFLYCSLGISVYLFQINIIQIGLNLLMVYLVKYIRVKYDNKSNKNV